MSVDTNEPHPLYLLGNKEKLQKRKDKANRNKLLEARKTVINSDFWDKFLLVAKVCYMRDKESDLYDVFEIYRTKLMGGWESTPEQIKKIDAVIAKEEQGYGFARG